MEYSKLVEVYEYLEKTSERLKKTERIAGLFSQTETGLLPKVVLLVQGKLFPSWSEMEIGIANLLMVRIISVSTGFSERHIMEKFKKGGDFGSLIEELIKNKKQQTLFQKKLSVEKVFDNLQKVAAVEGKGSQDRKFRLISELISSAQPREAKYIVRTILGDLRVGVADGVVRDAIAKAFFTDVVWDAKKMLKLIEKAEGKSFIIEDGVLEGLVSKKKIGRDAVTLFRKRNKVAEMPFKELEKIDPSKPKGPDYIFTCDSAFGSRFKHDIVSTIEWAWFLRPDYGEVTKIAKEKGLYGLKMVRLEVGKPYHVLLADRSPGLKEALEAFERPVLEYKYDGARIIIHKKGSELWFYTRRLENVTKQFPELREFARKGIRAKDCIVEGEMLGFDKKTGKPVAFQFLSQRIKRKYDIEKMVKEIPIQVDLFDIVYLNGRELFNEPLRKRRALLEKIIKPIHGKFQLAKALETKNIKVAEKFYKEALAAGQEGVIVKNLDARYQPGRRVAGGWLKVKPTLETLDLAIIGAQWGTGKRAGWIGSLILGCLDPDTEEFLECGMMGTGIKEKKTNPEDVTFEEITEMLKPLIVREEGGMVRVKPEIVVEVAYEEIQKSPNYSSGYALRFPRFVRLRPDKGPDEADDINRLVKIYGMQRGRN
jgi:ATP-dependent DNA ligase I